MKRNHISIGIIIMAIIILSMGCDKEGSILDVTNKNTDESVKDATEGGEVSLPLTMIGTLNPLVNNNQSYYYFSKLVFEGLFEFTDDFNVEGKLVENYTVEDNGRILNLELKDGISWHDGEKFDASDVIFTIEAIKFAGENKIYGELLKNGIGTYAPINVKRIITAEGEGNKLRISFDRAFSNNLEVLTFPILPAHKFNSIGDALRKDNFPLVGTGPFKFKSYENKKEIILLASDEYRGGRPYIDSIKGKVFNSDKDVRTAFETGQVGVTLGQGTDWEKYAQDEAVQLKEIPSGKYEFLAFNFKRDIFAGEDGKILRKAISHSIDKGSIVEKVYLNHAVETKTPINPKSWLYNDEVKVENYSINDGKKELAKLKYGKKDSDGYLLNEEGEKISLTLLTNTLNPMRRAGAEMIKQNLKELGIEVRITPSLEEDPIRTEAAIEEQWINVQNQMKQGDFDLALSGWDCSVLTDLSFMFNSEEVRSGSNFIGYKDDKMDELLLKAFEEGNDRQLKKENYDKVQERIAEEIPYVSICFRNEAVLVNGGIGGEFNPQFFNPYRGLEKAYITK